MRSTPDMSVIARQRQCLRGRRAHDDGRAAAGRRLDLQIGADERGPLAHADHAKSPAAYVLAGRIESDSVVLNYQRHVFGTSLEHDVDRKSTRLNSSHSQ